MLMFQTRMREYKRFQAKRYDDPKADVVYKYLFEFCTDQDRKLPENVADFKFNE